MVLLDAGYWQTTYWPSRYWQADYWPEYGVGVPPAPSGTSRATIPRVYRPPPPRFPLSDDTLELLLTYLELKLGEKT